MSPTQRSLKLLRDEGWLCQVVERWQPFYGVDDDGRPNRGGVRVDLFGMIDILAVNGPVTLGVQCTSGSNHADRAKKIRAHENFYRWKCSALSRQIEVHSWKKYAKPVGGKWWRVRREAL